MRTFLSLSVIALLSIFCSCQKLGVCVDRELQITRHDDMTGKIRLDGYYYSPADTDDNGIVLNEIMMFYKNGVVLLPGNASAGFEEGYLHSVSGFTGIRSSKSCWGAYSIDSVFSIARWKPSQCGAQAVLRKATILNDTTFMIKEMQIKGRYGTGTLPREQVFRFRSYFPKPDSLNDFVE